MRAASLAAYPLKKRVEVDHIIRVEDRSVQIVTTWPRRFLKSLRVFRTGARGKTLDRCNTVE